MDTWTPFLEALAGVRKLLLTQHDAGPIPGADPDSLLFRNLPADVYHADRDALSCSLLKPLLLSPAHFQAALVAAPKGSPGREFGSLVHLLLLQPHLVEEEVAVYPGAASGRDPDFKDFIARNALRLAVDEPTFAQAARLAARIAATNYKGRPLGHFVEESVCEATIYFTEPVTGLRLRIRLDVYHPDISFDLKTTRHGTWQAFARDAVELGYDLQAFMYRFGRRLYEGGKAAPFVFIAGETTPPHSICTLEAGETFLENGAAKFQSCLATFKACTAAAYWPDLSCSRTLEITPWQQFAAREEWRPQATIAVAS